MKSRTKTILSGKHLEVELYPVTAHGHLRERKRKLSSSAQRKLNEKNARKKLERLINSNFQRGDTIITLSYRAELRRNLDYAAVVRDVQNYLRRVKRWRNSHGLPYTKYIYVVELAGSDNWHAHLIMSAMPREVAENLWLNADFVNSKSFQPTAQEGGAAFANYIAGKKPGKEVQTKHWRKWNCSKNLAKPTEKVKDGTHTRRGLARIARERVDDSAYWERKYKGFRFVSARPVFNEFTGWWSLYVKMYRAEPPAAVYPSKRKPNSTAATRARS